MPRSSGSWVGRRKGGTCRLAHGGEVEALCDVRPFRGQDNALDVSNSAIL